MARNVDVTEPRYPLDRALPADVLIGGEARWFRYRQYPVFSVAWLRGRSFFAIALVTAWSSLNGVTSALMTESVSAGLTVATHQFFAFSFMSIAGPALATWIRYQNWTPTRERMGVIASILGAMICSAYVDQSASREVAAVLAQIPSMDTPDVPQSRVAQTFNYLFVGSVYALLGGALALRAWFSEQQRWQESERKRELRKLQYEKQQSEMTLSILQAQVEPHFLFNTLASIRALVQEDPRKAEITLDALVRHLRATIPKLRETRSSLHSTLGQQIEICESYLELMRLRLDDRVTWSVDVEAIDRALAFPPLLLITLVENSIKHGIEPKRGYGHIRLIAHREQSQIVVSVIDDGIGLTVGMGSGIGLANIRAQLATSFGDRASLSVSAEKPNGTRATLRLPIEEDL